MTDELQDYRRTLQELVQNAQESYDKTLLTLSGGALGVSFAFVSDIVGSTAISWPWFLVLAWIAWALSVTAVVFSFFFSNRALHKAIGQVDADSIYTQRPGGWYDRVTVALNIAGGLLFLCGVVSMVVFAVHNMTR